LVCMVCKRGALVPEVDLFWDSQAMPIIITLKIAGTITVSFMDGINFRRK
jgi:hypothetical protein